MPDLQRIRTETAGELGVDIAELDYLNEDVDLMTDDVGEETGADLPEEPLDGGRVLRTFDCRRPAYEGRWLYYYAGCAGVFSRVLRSRVIRISATGYCGVPTRKFKVWITG